MNISLLSINLNDSQVPAYKMPLIWCGRQIYALSELKELAYRFQLLATAKRVILATVAIFAAIPSLILYSIGYCYNSSGRATNPTKAT